MRTPIVPDLMVPATAASRLRRGPRTATPRQPHEAHAAEYERPASARRPLLVEDNEAAVRAHLFTPGTAPVPGVNRVPGDARPVGRLPDAARAKEPLAATHTPPGISINHQEQPGGAPRL